MFGSTSWGITEVFVVTLGIIGASPLAMIFVAKACGMCTPVVIGGGCTKGIIKSTTLGFTTITPDISAFKPQVGVNAPSNGGVPLSHKTKFFVVKYKIASLLVKHFDVRHIGCKTGYRIWIFTRINRKIH